MDEELIFDWTGQAKAREWYESLFEHYKWNARYWEQRALLESRLGHFPNARSYAEEAIRIQRHTFTLNTLGTILTKMAIEYLQPESRDAYNTFLEGIKYLKEARDIREDQTIHPFSTFFSRTIIFVKSVYVEKKSPIDDKIKSEWNGWIEAARRSSLFLHPEYKKLLEEFQRSWLLLAVKET
jgi:tetratricopeptide (TPR) repeat protein